MAFGFDDEIEKFFDNFTIDKFNWVSMIMNVGYHINSITDGEFSYEIVKI
ncbi:MAG: hypothetical protein NC548_13105 [Lachnospiraceae bacterium]|nr:hypothetical protein [Lachnospiraceae bacterium]